MDQFNKITALLTAEQLLERDHPPRVLVIESISGGMRVCVEGTWIDGADHGLLMDLHDWSVQAAERWGEFIARVQVVGDLTAERCERLWQESIGAGE